ncbi:MAG: DUF5661 family protein [Syntrophobacteraceae bacterium]|jgi:hypothetical protein
MEIPTYVTIEEVQRVCQALNIRDWTALGEAVVLPEEALAILGEIDANGLEIDPEDFRRGLEVELEHGIRYQSANVTNNHPILTGKIVLAHLKETLDYYDRLEVAELEGDLLKAALAGNSEKLLRLFKKLLLAKHALTAVESGQIGAD